MTKSSFDRFVRSKVGACALEMLVRIDIDTNEIQRHRIGSRRATSEY